MIGAIFATDGAGGFSNKGKIPWYVPDDFKYFKKITRLNGSKIVMGRKTWESLPGLLPNRDHIILSTTLGDVKGASVYRTPREILDVNGGRLWIIGGTGVLNAFKQECDYDILYHSVIYGTHEHDVTLNVDNLIQGMIIDSVTEYDEFKVRIYHNPRYPSFKEKFD